ncbi:MAG TPA: creatininase family protein [Bacteroidales bacterium]|nr:creatininase family protein [Bacteroidales bacterium]
MDAFILAESYWKDMKDQEIEVAVLPWGATEAHNLHLPFSTDNIMVERIARDSARVAWEKGARVIVLPVIPFGVNTGQMDIRLNINLNPSTQMAILDDITDVLNGHGIHKFLILNGHGGNDFKQMIRELGLRYPEMFICSANWFQSFNNSDYFENGGGHADEMETSIMQFIVPDMVKPLNEAGDGKGREFKIKALSEKWAWAERRWSEVTSDTGIGNPMLADSGKGERCYNEIIEKISVLLTELAGADIDNLYE